MKRGTRADGEEGQLSLGLDLPQRTPKPPSENLFFAVLPDDDAKARIVALAARLCREFDLRAQPIPSERLHVSLHRIETRGNPPPEIVASALRVGAALDAPVFHVTFDRVLSFKHTDSFPLVLGGGEELDALSDVRTDLGTAMEKAGVKRRRSSPYTPHVTLLYGGRPVRELEVDPICWTVRDVVLVKSLYGEGRHIRLGCWPLRG